MTTELVPMSDCTTVQLRFYSSTMQHQGQENVCSSVWRANRANKVLTWTENCHLYAMLCKRMREESLSLSIKIYLATCFKNKSPILVAFEKGQLWHCTMSKLPKLWSFFERKRLRWGRTTLEVLTPVLRPRSVWSTTTDWTDWFTERIDTVFGISSARSYVERQVQCRLFTHLTFTGSLTPLIYDLFY